MMRVPFAFHFQAVKRAEIEAFAQLEGFSRKEFQEADAVADIRRLPFVKDFALGGADDHFIHARGTVADRRRQKDMAGGRHQIGGADRRRRLGQRGRGRLPVRGGSSVSDSGLHPGRGRPPSAKTPKGRQCSAAGGSTKGLRLNSPPLKERILFNAASPLRSPASRVEHRAVLDENLPLPLAGVDFEDGGIAVQAFHLDDVFEADLAQDAAKTGGDGFVPGQFAQGRER